MDDIVCLEATFNVAIECVVGFGITWSVIYRLQDKLLELLGS